MPRLIATVQSGRFDPLPLITHRYALADIVEAYDLFMNRRAGVLKVAVTPDRDRVAAAERPLARVESLRVRLIDDRRCTARCGWHARGPIE